MKTEFKRHKTKCKFLILMLAMTALTACKGDTYMEISETVEPVETMEPVEPVEYNEAETGEPETLEDVQSLSIMETYQSFLNGELTAVFDQQQVYISDLFWDNDIEYCFGDIDSDGSEELHIRDQTVYYVVKVQDEMPRIIFEGWWRYEPVITDKLCGILFYSHEYGYEQIEFFKISADGSMESDGRFGWSDHNRNGNTDEEDSFSGPEDIDMEKYVQYKEEHVVKQTENELEWTGIRLKNYMTWQEAYIDFVKKMHVKDPKYADDFEYSLIYVDADEVPELYIDTGIMASGEIIVSFYDGNIGTMNRDRVGIRYMEYGGLLYNANGAMGFYPCNIYMLEKGEFSEIGTGWSYERFDEQGNLYFDYYWEGSPVTEAEYREYLNEMIDTSECIEPSVLYSEDEILEILMD